MSTFQVYDLECGKWVYLDSPIWSWYAVAWYGLVFVICLQLVVAGAGIIVWVRIQFKTG